MDFAVKFAQVEKTFAKFVLETSFQTFITLYNGGHGSGQKDAKSNFASGGRCTFGGCGL